MYPPNTGPQSRSPSIDTDTGTGIVSASATATRVRPATNLPRTADHVVSGIVMSNSMVPDFSSSAHRRMPSAGTRKASRTGSHSNSGRMSPLPRTKNPSTQKNENSEASRNVAMKISATGDRK